MTTITINTIIKSPISEVWKAFVNEADIEKWHFASDDWHLPNASNDLFVGGKFNYRMEAKDGSMGFNLGGTYSIIEIARTNKLYS